MGDGATENGIRLLATQKPTKRPGWWKGKFVLFQMLATGGGGWRTPVQSPTSPLPLTVGAFTDRVLGRGGYVQKQHSRL